MKSSRSCGDLTYSEFYPKGRTGAHACIVLRPFTCIRSNTIQSHCLITEVCNITLERIVYIYIVYVSWAR